MLLPTSKSKRQKPGPCGGREKHSTSTQTQCIISPRNRGIHILMRGFKTAHGKNIIYLKVVLF